MVRAKTRKQWPITQWMGNGEGIGGFMVEDDQGYNFNFATRKEAEEFRAACEKFEEVLDKIESEIVDKFRKSLRA